MIATCATAACNALRAGGAGENKLEKYLAETFPTYISADFAPLGVDFEFGQNVILALVNSQIEIPLAAIMSDVEGVFLLTVTLPADLAEGSYTVRARTYDHDIHSPPITVSGIAAQEGGGQGQREEDDGLLAPMPTFPPATPVLSSSSADSVTAPEPEAPSRLPIIVVGVLVALGVAILGIRLRNNR